MKFIISIFGREPKAKKGVRPVKFIISVEKKVRPVKYIILNYGGEPKQKKGSETCEIYHLHFWQGTKMEKGSETCENYHLAFWRGTEGERRK